MFLDSFADEMASVVPTLNLIIIRYFRHNTDDVARGHCTADSRLR